MKVTARPATGLVRQGVASHATTGDLRHWESYYSGGAVVSCPMGRSDGYDHEVRDAWRAFFGDLPDHAVIVDIATGNGAIPLIAREVAEHSGHCFEIHGVDLASIDPLKNVKGGDQRFRGIRFHPGVPAESLPFEDGSVTAVSSQYGLEYTDIRRTLGEIARVLQLAGRVQLIAHHAQSIVAEKARATLSLGTRMLDDAPLLQLTREYLRTEREDPARAATLHAQLSRISTELGVIARASVEPLFVDVALGWLAGMFNRRRTVPLEAVLHDVDAIETALRDWLQRVKDLLDAAWSAEEVKEVQELAAGAGLTVQLTEPQMHRAHLVGWRLQLLMGP